MSGVDDDIAEVKAFLARAKTAVSEGDVAAGTGLDVGSAKAALHALMSRYRSSLDVHDDGTLVYDFGAKLVPLGRRTFRERAAAVGKWLWKGFSFVYKASLAVVLVAYAVAFVVMIIAAAIAASSASKDEGPAEGAFRLVGAIFRAIFEFLTYTPIIYSDTDTYGYRHGHYEPKAPILPRRKKAAPQPKQHDKRFIASVYDFVLGPTRVEPHDRAQQQEVAAFVRANGGVLTIRDVQALSGLRRKEAEEFFAQFVAEQDGVAEISDQGALYATFEELLRSKSTEHDAPVELYWDEYEAPFELTGNTAGKNVLITLLAAFNLTCGYFVLNGAGELGNLGVWLGAVPTVIFSLFFLIPLLRAPMVWWRNRQQHAHNIRKRLFKAIFSAKDERLVGSEVVERANRIATTEEKLRIADIDELLDETLIDLGGDRELDETGEVSTDMTQLRIEEQAAHEHALAERDAKVVYTTK